MYVCVRMENGSGKTDVLSLYQLTHVFIVYLSVFREEMLWKVSGLLVVYMIETIRKY